MCSAKRLAIRKRSARAAGVDRIWPLLSKEVPELSSVSVWEDRLHCESLFNIKRRVFLGHNDFPGPFATLIGVSSLASLSAVLRGASRILGACLLHEKPHQYRLFLIANQKN